jgi:hypothetical protein
MGVQDGQVLFPIQIHLLSLMMISFESETLTWALRIFQHLNLKKDQMNLTN